MKLPEVAASVLKQNNHQEMLSKDKLYNGLYRFQSTILGLAIFISLLAVSVHIDNGTAQLAWQDRPFIALSIISIGLFLFLLYVWVNNYRVHQLSQQRQKGASNRLSELTARQREVYDLIIEGKSNKEIVALLFIEHSTLKTHINQIYKKLGIKNRRELKNQLKT